MANRARKAGDARDIERKQEERYDEVDGSGIPDNIIRWINSVTEGVHPPCPGKTFAYDTIAKYLKDGVAICKLINKLLAADGKDLIKFKEKASSSFVAMANIETFNGALLRYGLKEDGQFQSVDLFEGHKGPMLNVINSLNKLGVVANSKGFTPAYEAAKRPDRDPEHWSAT